MAPLTREEKAVLKFLCEYTKKRPLAPDEDEIRHKAPLGGIDPEPILRSLETGGFAKSQQSYAPVNCRWYATPLGERAL